MSEAPTMRELCTDLTTEHEWLRDLVIALSMDQLNAPTPAEGWTVRDQLTHLAWFDERAVEAVVDPEAFSRDVERATTDFESYEAEHLATGRAMDPTALIGWFSGSRSRLVNLFSTMDPKERLAWYGPPMSARSSATARFMETWAHGLDVADALGVEKVSSENVRHVCDLGVRTRGWSYAVRSLQEPAEPVHVSLVSPSGTGWEWGDPAARDSVSGSAHDFACVVTQRRPLSGTDLTVRGSAAGEWMSIAQCFAGPPGKGRGR